MLKKASRKKLLAIAAMIGAVLAGGTLGYSLIEGWSLFDSLYMTVITLATVGYSEIHPLSGAGRAFTIFLIFSGVGVLTYAISNITAFFVEGELKGALKRSKMQSKINSMKNHYVLCGSGHIGEVILAELMATGKEVVAVEIREQEYQRLLEKNIPAVLGDATKDETLRKAGIERAAGLFTALGSDRDNAFVALVARGLNPSTRIVAEQVDEGVQDKLIRSGADAVIRPSQIGGLRMASTMIRPTVVNFLDAMMREPQGALRIEEVTVLANSSLAGQPVKNLKDSQGQKVAVLAVRPKGRDSYVFNPPEDHPVTPGETLIVMATPGQRQELAQKLS